jgi:mono/diheme cytochrome c family protein
MKSIRTVPVVLGIVLAGAAGSGAAADKRPKVDLGKAEYDANCMVCHGAKGKGDGSYGELLKTKLPDLTTLAKNNGGVFPYSRVYEVVDGRQEIKAHGSREMPIWGQRYSMAGAAAAGHYVDVPYDMEAFVRGRILALVDYIYRLQAK